MLFDLFKAIELMESSHKTFYSEKPLFLSCVPSLLWATIYSKYQDKYSICCEYDEVAQKLAVYAEVFIFVFSFQKKIIYVQYYYQVLL